MPTSNPVPSQDPSDLLFNAEKLDEVVSGVSQYYTDRFGVNRRTMAGIDAAADVVLGGIGYAPPVAHAAGISLTLTTQTVEYQGNVYAPKLSSLPFTTGTTFDFSKFRLIQGVTADDLAASGGASMIGAAGGGSIEQYLKSGHHIINVDHPPYSGNFLSAYNAIPSNGGVVLKLGKRSYSIFGIGDNTKPNVSIIGEGCPQYDSVNKRLVDGSGTILQGQLYNQAKGLNVFNLGIDYGDWVRVNLAGGQYNDAFCNINVGIDAAIKYGDIIVLASDVVAGNPASNTHCILNQAGAGFQQTGIVKVIGGYHGHVIKVYDFVGDTTVAKYQTADGLIIKADSGASAGKVVLNSIIINGDASRSSAGVLLEAQSQSLSSITIGKIVAINADYVIAEAAATNAPIVDVNIGSITAGGISGAGGGITQAVVIGEHSVGYAIGRHALNSCVKGGLRVANGAKNVDIGSGYSKSSSGGDGYLFDAPARHGKLYSGENTGWGVRNNANDELNAEDITCVQNALGGISSVMSIAVTFQNSWTDGQGTFRAARYGGGVRISGQLIGGATGAVGAWVTVAQLSGLLPVFDEYLSCCGFDGNGLTKPLIAKVNALGQIQVYGMATQSVTGVSLSGSYVFQGQ
ncbi:hypothetical protein [Malikia spinosa]|uniref:hypothetical protein n=1 Tax=Malikia spinosa TaxID=86180 RepID=UPI0026C0F896